jgi:tight adherence protein C
VFDAADALSMLVFVAVFLATAGLVVLVYLKWDGDGRKASARLRELSAGDVKAPGGVGEMALSALPRVGTLLMPAEGKQKVSLQTRMRQAGFYGPLALRVFLGAKMVLVALLPPLFGLTPYTLGLVSGKVALMLAACGGGVGLVAPGLWLDHMRRKRQSHLRQAIPDALDMMVLCMEGGLSLLVTVQRVTAELQTAHPLLASEMNVVFREVQLGMSVGEAFRRLGQRCDLEEVRNLASVLLQSERYGASVVKALRIHADSCRQERQQRAEEMAQKAAVKILFPTLLCIFPAIFIVILGPAAYQLSEMFSKM